MAVNPREVAQVREDLRLFAWTHGLDVVQRAVEELAAEAARPDRPESAPAIWSYLHEDLATFPPAFRRRLGPWIDEAKHDLARARDLLQQFERARSPRPPSASSCSCGCFDGNDIVAYCARLIRGAALELRNAKTPRKRATRRATLQERKDDMLERLWFGGVRTIDRLQLGQHAVDSTKHAIERLRDNAQRLEKWAIRPAVERLAAGVVLKGRRKGQPLTDEEVMVARKRIDSGRNAVAQSHEEIARLERLMREDVPRLVHEYSGCAREAA